MRRRFLVDFHAHPRHSPFDTSVALAKKPNYGFEKRQKELDRQKKKDAKQQARLQRTATEKATEKPPLPDHGEHQSQ